MERKFVFNDEFVAPKIEALVAVGIGRDIITPEQMQLVRDVLEIEGNSLEELRAKRNFCVKLLGDEEDKYYSTMSGVTFVLDSRIWNLSGEC